MAYHRTDKPKNTRKLTKEQKRADRTRLAKLEAGRDASRNTYGGAQNRPTPSMPTIIWIKRADESLERLAAAEQKPEQGD